MNKELLNAIAFLSKEKGVSTDVICDSLEAVLITAYKKEPEANPLADVELNRETGDYRIVAAKTVVEDVVNDHGEISLADVRKCINFIQITNAKCIGLVENMSGLVCPHCGGRIDLFKHGGGEELAKKDSIPFLGAIPLDLQAVVSADNGVPVVTVEGDSPAKAAFMEVTKNIVAQAEKA